MSNRHCYLDLESGAALWVTARNATALSTRKAWIQWSDKIQNGISWRRKELNPVAEEIRQQRWWWMRHTPWKSQNSTMRDTLKMDPQWKRICGRMLNNPGDVWWRMIWRERLEENDLKRGALWCKDLTRIAQDMNEWKSVARGLYPDIGWKDTGDIDDDNFFMQKKTTYFEKKQKQYMWGCVFLYQEIKPPLNIDRK